MLAGSPTTSSDGRRYEVFEPATGELLAEVCEAGGVELERAIVLAQ